MRLLTGLQLFFTFALLACVQEVYAIDGLYYKVEAQGSVSTGENTPFWLVNNREGLASIEKNNGYIRAGLFREIEPEKRF